MMVREQILAATTGLGDFRARLSFTSRVGPGDLPGIESCSRLTREFAPRVSNKPSSSVAVKHRRDRAFRRWWVGWVGWQKRTWYLLDLTHAHAERREVVRHVPTYLGR